jgi:hypothetical protein
VPTATETNSGPSLATFISSKNPDLFARALVGGDITPASIWPAASAV